MELPPLKDRPFAISIERRSVKNGEKYYIRIKDPISPHKWLNFGQKTTRDEAVKEAVRLIFLYEEQPSERRSLAALLPEAQKKRLPEPPKPVGKSDIPLGEFIDDIYLRSLDIRDSTKSDYRGACDRIKNYIYATSADGKPLFWKDRPLNSITTDEIHRFNADYQNDTAGTFLVRVWRKGERVWVLNDGTKPHASNTCRKFAQRIRHIFNYAVAYDYLKPEQHPYRPGIGKMNQLPERPSLDTTCPLSHEALDKMLAILNAESRATGEWGREADFWYHLIGTALWSGLRLSELLGLQRDDLLDHRLRLNVDTQWGWATIKKEVKKKGGKKQSKEDDKPVYIHEGVFVTPKSKASVRTVPLEEGVYKQLTEWAQKMRKEKAPDELLFPRPLPDLITEKKGLWGHWGSSSNFHRRFTEMQEKVWGLYLEEMAKKPWEEPFPKKKMIGKFHGLRHTYASICLSELLLDPNSVSAWLGHANVAFTYEVYSGLIDSVHDDAAMKMRNAGRPKQTVVV